MSFMISKMMFKGETALCKVKAILLPVKLKASPGRQGAKGIPRNLKKGQIHRIFGGYKGFYCMGLYLFSGRSRESFLRIQLLKDY